MKNITEKETLLEALALVSLEKAKKVALTWYEKKKAATKDEVEIAIINILESYWKNK